jgi:hypothetical protein
VRDALGAEAAGAVLRDQAWPALADALQQAEQLGAQPAQLLRQVAGERELTSAKSVAEVLGFRIEQRTPTAADVTSSSYPTPLTTASSPTLSDRLAAARGDHAHKQRAAGTDRAALGAAVELGRVADAERRATQTGFTPPSVVSGLGSGWQAEPASGRCSSPGRR